MAAVASHQLQIMKFSTSFLLFCLLSLPGCNTTIRTRICGCPSICLLPGFVIWPVRKKYPAVLYFIGLAFYSVYAILLLFDKNGVLNWLTEHNAENIAQSMKATRPWIEAAREFFGLLIIIAVLVVNLIWMKKQKNAGGKTEVKRNG
jgi:hypothetical protein